MSKDFKIILSIAVVILVIGILLFVKGSPTTTTVNMDIMVKENSHMTRNKTAKVNVVEFGDFQCPACAVATPTFEQIMTEYKDNPEVNFVFRHFPLPKHAWALTSAEAVEAAGEQGKFWEMYKLVYERQDQWVQDKNPQEAFQAFALELGLDQNKFKESMTKNKFNSFIQNDYKDGISLNINATPTFFINQQIIVGVPTLAQLKGAIEAELLK